MSRLEELLQQEQELKARIEEAKRKLDPKARKIRTSRLLAWGLVVEKLLEEGAEGFTAENVKTLCHKYLKGRDLTKALTGPLKEPIEPCPP